MPSKHVKKRSISCVNREIQRKTRHHHTPTEWPKSRTLPTSGAGADAEQGGL